MAMLRYLRYPNAFSPTTPMQPQGGFKNRSAPQAKDGTYLEKDWANDWSGFFSSLLVRAGVTPNGLVDNATASQYYDALMILINSASYDRYGDTVGSVVDFPTTAAPPGFLKANGAAVRRSDFPKLFARIGTKFGAGDGATTFNLPDLRGKFSRAWDDTAGVDPGRQLGSLQYSQNLSHTHTASSDSQGGHTHSLSINAVGNHDHAGSIASAGSHSHTAPRAHNDNVGGGSPNFTTANRRNGDTAPTNQAGEHTHSMTISAAGSHTHSGTVSSAAAHSHNIYIGWDGGSESRPINVALLRCIKY